MLIELHPCLYSILVFLDHIKLVLYLTQRSKAMLDRLILLLCVLKDVNRLILEHELLLCLSQQVSWLLGYGKWLDFVVEEVVRSETPQE